jgi:chitinase
MLIFHCSPGCGAGNCLRSQVNRTETQAAFSMITKAGVPSNKVLVGMALYGRSFQMTTPGCYTEMCTYTGPACKSTSRRYCLCKPLILILSWRNAR